MPEAPGGALQIRWPRRKDVLPSGRHGSWREWLKYHARLWQSRPHQGAFLEFLSANPVMGELFASGPRLFHSPLSRFLDRRFSMKERFGVAQADLGRAIQHLGAACIRQMARGMELTMFVVEPYVITLGLNEVNPQEGLWSLAIRSAAAHRLYSLSFGFTEAGAVLVGSLQGARLPGDAALSFGRDFTKAAHGLRPPCFLMHALRSLCDEWRIGTILGIDPAHHVKGRWNQRRKRLKFDYRGFWIEQQGRRNGRGYWELSTAAEARELDDVPTRKRSMYRRRFKMLDELRYSAISFIGSDAAKSAADSEGALFKVAA